MYTLSIVFAIYALLLFINFFVLAIVPELKILVISNIILITIGFGTKLYLKKQKDKNAY